jgi:chitinase
MDTDTFRTGKKWLLTAAPQCPYPDAADNAMLNGAVAFDAIWVQFYNNYCGLQSFTPGATTQNNFNFATWDNWAKTVSKNPAVKVFLGIPGSSSAAGSGYESGSTLASIISYCKQFSSFGGVMTWDMSQIYANAGFLDGVNSDLGGAAGTGPVSTSTVRSTATTAVGPTSTFVTVTTKTSSVPTTTTTAGGSWTVPQWGQCGGNGYTGPTACVAPYTCVQLSVWWSQCE